MNENDVVRFFGFELDRKCMSCDGTGDNGDGESCLECGGTGFELTEAGETLMRFIERHAK